MIAHQDLGGGSGGGPVWARADSEGPPLVGSWVGNLPGYRLGSSWSTWLPTLSAISARIALRAVSAGY